MKNNRKSYYPYVEEFEEDVKQEIQSVIEYGYTAFNISHSLNGEQLVQKIEQIIINILETKEYPNVFEDTEDVAVTLGCLYGKALEIGYGWKWKAIGNDEEDAQFSVVSPDDYYMIPVLSYIYNILLEKNIGPDGNNDITCVLLYNMIPTLSIPEYNYTMIH